MLLASICLSFWASPGGSQNHLTYGVTEALGVASGQLLRTTDSNPCLNDERGLHFVRTLYMRTYIQWRWWGVRSCSTISITFQAVGRVATMNFGLPPDLEEYISKVEVFINSKILPIQEENIQFFDHRREPSRTQWNNNGLPSPEWEALLTRARNIADEAGFYRFALPKKYGGQDGSNLWMCALRYHMASHPVYGGGVSLANDLQNEHSVVGNFPDFLMLYHWGSEQQKNEFIPARLEGRFRQSLVIQIYEVGLHVVHRHDFRPH